MHHCMFALQVNCLSAILNCPSCVPRTVQPQSINHRQIANKMLFASTLSVCTCIRRSREHPLKTTLSNSRRSPCAPWPSPLVANEHHNTGPEVWSAECYLSSIACCKFHQHPQHPVTPYSPAVCPVLLQLPRRPCCLCTLIWSACFTDHQTVRLAADCLPGSSLNPLLGIIESCQVAYANLSDPVCSPAQLQNCWTILSKHKYTHATHNRASLHATILFRHRCYCLLSSCLLWESWLDLVLLGHVLHVHTPTLSPNRGIEHAQALGMNLAQSRVSIRLRFDQRLLQLVHASAHQKTGLDHRVSPSLHVNTYHLAWLQCPHREKSTPLTEQNTPPAQCRRLPKRIWSTNNMSQLIHRNSFCNDPKCRSNSNLDPISVRMLSEASRLHSCSLAEIPSALSMYNTNQPFETSQNGYGQVNNQRGRRLLLRSKDNWLTSSTSSQC